MACPTFERQLQKWLKGETQSTSFAALCGDHKKVEVIEYVQVVL